MTARQPTKGPKALSFLFGPIRRVHKVRLRNRAALTHTESPRLASSQTRHHGKQQLFVKLTLRVNLFFLDQKAALA